MEKILESLRNPTVFNGLAVLAYLSMGLTSLHTESWSTPKIIFAAVCMGMIGVITGWLNYFAWKNPRFLAYGTQEYLRESEMEHERRMASKP